MKLHNLLSLFVSLGLILGGCRPKQPETKPSPIAIPLESEILKKLESISITNPNQIDSVMKELEASPSLLNFYLSTPIDLSKIGLGRGIFIPVQVSNLEGGRPSIFFAPSGQKILNGIFVIGGGILLQYRTKTSESNYKEEWMTLDGKIVFQGDGKIENLDLKTGSAKLSVRLIGGRDFPQLQRTIIIRECDCTFFSFREKCREIIIIE